VQGEAQAILPEPYTLNPTPWTLHPIPSPKHSTFPKSHYLNHFRYEQFPD